MASADIEAVRVYKGVIDGLLDRATQVKPAQIEPPLTEGLLGDRIWQVPEQDQGIVKQLSQQTQYASVEIAFRQKFYPLVNSTSIEDPAFVHIWNLLDIVSIFSDNGSSRAESTLRIPLMFSRTMRTRFNLLAH
jgi:THO complex subunit 1